MRTIQRFNVSRAYKLLIMDLGLSPNEVLQTAGLPTNLLERQDGSLSGEEYFQIWRALERIVGGDELPLRIARVISVEGFDPAIFASLCSPNLNVALQRLRQYKRLIGPMCLDLKIGPQHTAISIHYLGNAGPMPNVLGMTEMVFLTRLARLATRHQIMPSRVTTPSLPRNLDDYHTFFGVRPVLADKHEVAFHADDAQRPFVTEDTRSWDFFEPRLNQRLYELNEETTAQQRVRFALLQMLPSGESSIDEVAKRLSMSKRSLQRRLQEEGAAYQDLLSNLRKELAQHYLSRSRLSSGEISYLLGFHDANSFIRAFNRWTGTTPGEYRRRYAYD